MNDTRRDWSGIHHCIKGKRDSLTAFYSLATAIFIITISFYSAVYYVGMKYESTDTLDEREVSQNSRKNISEGNDSEPGPSSAGPSKVRTKTPNMSINKDDSDDELIIGSSPSRPQNENLILLDNWKRI